MPSNEEIIRNLYAVAEKEPKRFRSLFTENGYWWDVPAGVKYHGDEIAHAAGIHQERARQLALDAEGPALRIGRIQVGVEERDRLSDIGLSRHVMDLVLRRPPGEK